jgi:prepilin-type N-terminal cleavage/methylation domain-containing protein
MRASCIDASPRQDAGFTLPELVMVLMLVAVLAAVALPKLDGALSMRSTAWRDQVLAALRHARSVAQSHRRLVCATVATGSVTLQIAAAHPANACTSTLPGPDGAAAFAVDASAIATTLAPGGNLYFQPSGRVTSDGAGSAAANRTITIAGETDIVVIGETGHVE